MKRTNPIDGQPKPKPFRIHDGTEITQDLINKFITKHQALIARYNYLVDMYKNVTEVFDLPEKEAHKPDNRLSVNYAKYIVDTFVGYFNGIPIKKSHKDDVTNELLQLFDSSNDIEDEENELARLACIYGHCFEIIYQNITAQTKAIYVDPTECFMVYDTTKEMNPLFAVYYVADEEGEVTGTLYTKTEEIDLKGTIGEVVFAEKAINVFKDVPVVEYMLNDDRLGLFEGVASLINAMNKAISEKANDVDYFADAYLAVIGAELDEKSVKAIRDNRVINVYGLNGEKVDVRFLDKPNSDDTQEHLLNRLHKLIFQVSMVADISDENFGAVSGVALEHKYQAMNNLAHSFDRKFQAGLRRRYQLVFSLPVNMPENKAGMYREIEYTFKRNMPIDHLSQAQAAVATSNLTSLKTALKVLDIVEDVDAELIRIDEEREKNMEYGFSYNDSEAKENDREDNEEEVI